NGGAIDDGLQSFQRPGPVGRLDITQVDQALGLWRRGVDGLAALDDAYINRDGALQIGERVHGDDLVRQLADGADALLEAAARMRGPAQHLDAHEYPALAARDDVAAGSAGLRVEDAAGMPRNALDDGARRWRGDLLVRRDETGERRRRAAEA